MKSVKPAIAELEFAWERDGYVVLPGFLSPATVARLRQLCDHVLEQWRVEQPEDTTNIAYLTDLRWWQGAEAGLAALLELTAESRVLALAEALGGAPPLFHNTQYFMEPRTKSWAGAWHRDCQFLAGRPEREPAVRAAFTSLHARLALAPDDALEILPGSHDRADSELEAAVRWAADPAARTQALPGGRRIALAAGDLCLFHAFSIHRGHYERGRPRRGFDVLLITAGRCASGLPDPAFLREPGLLDRLSPAARAFYERFRDSYRDHWESEGRWAT